MEVSNNTVQNPLLSNNTGASSFASQKAPVQTYPSISSKINSMHSPSNSRDFPWTPLAKIRALSFLVSMSSMIYYSSMFQFGRELESKNAGIYAAGITGSSLGLIATVPLTMTPCNFKVTPFEIPHFLARVGTVVGFALLAKNSAEEKFHLKKIGWQKIWDNTWFFTGCGVSFGGLLYILFNMPALFEASRCLTERRETQSLSQNRITHISQSALPSADQIV